MSRRIARKNGCLHPVVEKAKSFGGRLKEIRRPKILPEPEKLITKDTYKKFDTTGLVERLAGFLQGVKVWTCSKIHKSGTTLDNTETVLYFPPDVASNTSSTCLADRKTAAKHQT